MNYNFDGDELFSVQAANNSWSHLMAVSLRDRPHPPLHLFLLFVWIKAWGGSEISARLLSILASVILLFVVYNIARRWVEDFAVWLVLGICAVSPFFIYYGQQARPYSLISLFASLTVLLYLKCLEKPKAAGWEAGYGAACAALMYSQYIGAVILFPQFASLIFFKPRRWRMLLFGGAGAVTVLPWLFAVGKTVLPSSGKLQENIGWIPKPTPFDVVSSYVSLFGWLPHRGSTAILILLSAGCLASLLWGFKRVDRKALVLAGCLAVLQPAALFLLSVYGPVSMWAPRQAIGAATFIFVFLGIALGLHRRVVGVALGLILIAWCAFGVPDAFPEYSKPPWRSLAGAIDGMCSSCDVVGAESWISFPLGHYAKKAVSDFSEYESRIGQADQVVFLCRPAHCEMEKKFAAAYDVAERHRISWSREPASATNMIDVYRYEKLPKPRQR